MQSIGIKIFAPRKDNLNLLLGRIHSVGDLVQKEPKAKAIEIIVHDILREQGMQVPALMNLNIEDIWKEMEESNDP